MPRRRSVRGRKQSNLSQNFWLRSENHFWPKSDFPMCPKFLFSVFFFSCSCCVSLSLCQDKDMHTYPTSPSAIQPGGLPTPCPPSKKTKEKKHFGSHSIGICSSNSSNSSSSSSSSSAHETWQPGIYSRFLLPGGRTASAISNNATLLPLL